MTAGGSTPGREERLKKRQAMQETARRASEAVRFDDCEEAVAVEATRPRHRMAPGDDERYESPPKRRAVEGKKAVRWDRGLVREDEGVEEEVEPAHRLREPECRIIKVRVRSCLSFARAPLDLGRTGHSARSSRQCPQCSTTALAALCAPTHTSHQGHLRQRLSWP